MWLEMTSAIIKIKLEYIYVEFWEFGSLGFFFFFASILGHEVCGSMDMKTNWGNSVKIIVK